MPLPQVTCTKCQKTFRARPGTSLCNTCSAKDRECVACGASFRGRHLKCRACRRTTRACVTCGTVFSGDQDNCLSCSRSERACKCGRAFVGRGTLCGSCRGTLRACRKCGRSFKGTNLDCKKCTKRPRHCRCCGEPIRSHISICGACRAAERACPECGQPIRWINYSCATCQSRGRECVQCGLFFYGKQKRCYYCRAKDRICTKCGEPFYGAASRCGPCRGRRIREAMSPAEINARAAAHERRRIAAAGPEPEALKERIRTSGPCVYCDGEADSVDHIVPVLQGGTHDEENLVPACRTCNGSKGNRRLTRWRKERVAHAVTVSPKVAAVYREQVAYEAQLTQLTGAA